MVREILFELMDQKASTVRVLRERLKLPKSSIYYALDFLESEGLVVQARPLRTKGRPATVYALMGYTPDDIAEAIQRDGLERTPGYSEAQRMSQLILDDYFSRPDPRRPLYTRDDIIPVLKRETRGFMWWDLQGLVLASITRAQVPWVKGGRR